MASVGRYLGQAFAYAAFAVAIGVFSTEPAYTHLDPGTAVVKLSFSHGGARVAECKRLSADEIAALAPNMRRALDCPRRRVPVVVDLELDRAPLYHAALPPTGLAGDGASTVYERFVVPAGRHTLRVRLRDSRRESGYDHESEVQVDLVPAQSLVIDFRSDAGGFRVF